MSDSSGNIERELESLNKFLPRLQDENEGERNAFLSRFGEVVYKLRDDHDVRELKIVHISKKPETELDRLILRSRQKERMYTAEQRYYSAFPDWAELREIVKSQEKTIRAQSLQIRELKQGGHVQQLPPASIPDALKAFARDLRSVFFAGFITPGVLGDTDPVALDADQELVDFCDSFGVRIDNVSHTFPVNIVSRFKQLWNLLVPSGQWQVLSEQAPKESVIEPVTPEPVEPEPVVTESVTPDPVTPDPVPPKPAVKRTRKKTKTESAVDGEEAGQKKKRAPSQYNARHQADARARKKAEFERLTQENEQLKAEAAKPVEKRVVEHMRPMTRGDRKTFIAKVNKEFNVAKVPVELAIVDPTSEAPNVNANPSANGSTPPPRSASRRSRGKRTDEQRTDL